MNVTRRIVWLEEYKREKGLLIEITRRKDDIYDHTADAIGYYCKVIKEVQKPKRRLKMYWKYLKYVLLHKWYVFIECCKLHIPWRGLVHDMSKFRPSEFIPYANFFYGGKPYPRDSMGYYKPTDTGNKAFDFAWLLHQKRNRHHWQWWCLPEDEGCMKILEMPETCVRELVADWKGAGKAQGKPDVVAWYERNKGKMKLHSKTRERVKELLGIDRIGCCETEGV